ncbi:amino acid adenylation domain-containing protein [Paracoccus caeni]|uniref:Amino acid adenylation domain-containing protein n=1 Tax=Paracoccus caeni TaxID=657651 RepID=A0A934SKC6_9RHOB|nr:non-ribosomal peptide synthetase [Paracoccus caeni]MBK4215983.1 amino acid adenylation domain-containing protein [Paracoccus caeni]
MNQIDLKSLDPAQKRALLAQRLKSAAQAGEVIHAPLSAAQQRLWFIDQMQPGQSVYTITAALTLEGVLDQARLTDALDRIRARHGSLRTRFTDQDGQPVQKIDPATPLPLTHHDLTAAPGTLDEVLAAFTAEPFDLATGPLVRCALIRLGAERHVLAFAAHHIIADYRSLQIMIAELAAFYDGRAATIPPLSLQYSDHALAQRRRAPELERQADYWRETLSGLPPLLDLPTDHPRPARQSHQGARHRFTLPDTVTARIEALARDRGVTPFMVLLAGFHLLHARYTGSADICIGTTVSNRDRAELQGLVGYFVNTLALRCPVQPDDTFDSLLTRLRGAVTGAMVHQELPFEQVVDLAATGRSMAHAPLFQSMFNLHEKQPDRIAFDGLVASPLPLPGGNARFDLSLDLFRGEQITGVLEYATALFQPETAERMARDYVRLLDAASADPARPLAGIALVEGDDLARLSALNDSARPIHESDLASLIAAAASQSNATALIAGEHRLSHVELDAAANRLAHYLAPQVTQGARIAICLPRTADLVVALLAALKLGAAYVPLDPNHPPKRLQLILEDAAPALMLTAGSVPVTPDCTVIDLDSNRDAIAACPATALNRPITGDDLAYVIFTSGTTGRPKGVPIRQSALVNLLTSMAERPGMTDADTLIAVTTPAFDIAALELFLPLLTGGTLVLADPYDVIDGHALAALISRTKATLMQATPATWRLLIEEGWQAPQGFRVLTGGEALDPALARDLLNAGGEVWNLYGPTETTIWSACAYISDADAARALIPLGQPVANTTLHVLDAGGQMCPPGVAGELHIGGAGLSPGYLDRADLTADRFVTIRGERLYRTGDRAKRLADGTLIYLGRLDFQVKLRGFRIEPGEIEAQLAADPEVDQAVVSLHGEGDDAALVAYCRSTALPEVLEPRLRARLSETVPGYMMPAAFVVLDRFPLNANGKVDRARLPAPASRAGITAGSTSGPRTGTEAILARLWQELLNIPAPDRDADFFALGGHSLMAMRMIARLPHEGNRAVPLRLLFENPRLADFAAALDGAGLIRPGTVAPIPRLPENAERTLSFAQTRQWTLAALDPGQSAYNLPAALRLTGAVEADRLARAWELVAKRHEVLRSAYPATAGKPGVAILPGLSPMAQDDTTETALPDTLRTEAARPFDLSRGPLARLKLWRVGGDHVLLLVLHHIIGDALSLQIVLRDLMQIYAALDADPAHRPAPLPVQYADFAAWQRQQDLDRHTRFWVNHLRGAPPLLDLPTDFPRPARQGFAGGSVDFTLPAVKAQRLRDLAARHGATPYMAMMTAYAALLGRYAETDEVVIGTPVTARPHPDLEGLAGMFVNTLAFRLPARDDNGFGALLDTCRDRVLAGLEHQDAPFERIVEELEPERSWSHNPVFQAMFSWKTREGTEDVQGTPDWQPLRIDSSTSKLDITLGVLDRGDDFALRIEYRRDLFRPETAENMALAFQALIDALLDAPDLATDRLSLLHPDQAAQIAAWNHTTPSPQSGPQLLHSLFAQQAASSGERLAVRDMQGAITYAALDRRSDVLAAHLQGKGIGRGDRVGIALPRNIDLITALLAVLKTGAAYGPLDPRYPAERIAYIAGDAQLALILGAGGMDLAGFWDGAPGQGETRNGEASRPSVVDSDPGDLAYLIYTSGSTGNPKGVAIRHRNAAALIRWAEGAFAPEELAGMLGSTSICFDLSVFEIFVTLSLGGTLMLVEDLFALPDAPFADQVTLINTVPTPMAELLRLGPLPGSIRTVCLAGEVLPPALAKRLHQEPGAPKVWNLYGPSEDTTYSTGMILPREGGFNIGQPLPDTRAYVLDAHGQPVPPGMPGELYLAGAGVAQGYWNRDDLSADRFLPDPFAGDGIMYRTGDKVRRTHDGSLDYLGRGDRQVKVRGFRVEPGEVETALTLIRGVTGAAVDIWRDADGNARLTAWVEGDVRTPDLTAALVERLPAHLVPTLFVVVPALPRLPNGKLDRKALPAPNAAEASMPDQRAEPQPGLETRLAAIWQRVLGVETVSRQDNFFAIGGDSILAIQVVAQAREGGIALSPRDLFQYGDLAALAEAAADRSLTDTAGGPVTGRQALTPIQHWLLNRDLPQADRWNQAMVLTPARPLDPALLGRALTMLSDSHDALRARFRKGDAGWEQSYAEPGLGVTLVQASGDVTEAATGLQSGFDLTDGPLWGAALVQTGDGQRLAVAAHHLLVDGVSWRILLGDLQRIYLALEAGIEPEPLQRGTSAGAWADFLADSPLLAAELPYWTEIAAQTAPSLPLAEVADTEGAADRLDSRIDADLTRQVLHDVPAAYPVTAPELLVSALYLAMRDWTGAEALAVEMESHGRADLSPQIDLSRTVGWLTAAYPVHLTTPDARPEDVLRMAKESLRRVPNEGVGYGVLRMAGAVSSAPAQVRFNYLGQAGGLLSADSLLRPAPEGAGPARGAENPRDVPIELNIIAGDDGLRLGWNYGPARIAPAAMAALADGFARHLDALTRHCLTGEDAGFTPSDFPDMDLGMDDLEDLLRSL